MIATRIAPKVRDLGDGFQVRRALPVAGCRSVGPFVFFDQMGPVTLEAGKALDVRPHPHIGLATVTYLFEGEILHRDSLGNVQPIRPREVNWMTAGRGIVHSERTPQELRGKPRRMFGLQTWLALPLEAEEDEPSFSHHGNLPTWEEGGVAVTLILGDLLGLASPVPTLSPTIYADIAIEAARRFVVPAAHDERGIHVVDGRVEIDGQSFDAGEVAVLEPGSESIVSARSSARFMLFGGAGLDAPRHVWWNFVSSREERIAQAAADWEAGRFPKVPGETEFIPLPERGRPKPVSYP